MREIYMHQIEAAQKFLDTNSEANIELLQILLRSLIPEEYHHHIARLKPGKHARPAKPQSNIYCITGGHNIISPNAKDVIINFGDMPPQEPDDEDEAESDTKQS